jgi:hypothetical protein
MYSKEKAYETVLRSPGMEEEVKIVVRAKRREILLMNQVIERGLAEEEKKGGMDGTVLEALKALSSEFLAHAKFSPDFIESWKELTSGKIAG